MNAHVVEIDSEGGRSCDLAYILDNPIPARCKKCKRAFTDGHAVHILQFVDGELKERIVVCNDAIRAPALSGCRCFYCSGELAPLERGGPATVEQVEQQRSREKQQPMLAIF